MKPPDNITNDQDQIGTEKKSDEHIPMMRQSDNDGQVLAASIGVKLTGLRHIYFPASVAICISLLTACVGISTTELQSIGSKISPENINFGELYTYAERANAAYAAKSVIRSKYPSTVRINSPDQTDVRYFLERNDKSRTQFITVRGSANRRNFSEDFDIAVRERLPIIEWRIRNFAV